MPTESPSWATESPGDALIAFAVPLLALTLGVGSDSAEKFDTCTADVASGAYDGCSYEQWSTHDRSAEWLDTDSGKLAA